MYKCECGKEFNNAQKFNGHKSNCKQHLQSKGIAYNDWLESKRLQGKMSKQAQEQYYIAQRQEKDKKWIEEQHLCEHCGKIMTEKFGSGRFCSRSCANSKSHSEETKMKIKTSIHRTYSIVEKFCSICGKKLNNHNKYGLCRSCYNKNYPEEVKQKQSVIMQDKPRWNIHRNQKSFAEKFWEEVLKNNNIQFKSEVSLKYDEKHCYFLDFEIEKGGKLIDLEIDGQQHLYRVIEDKIRDNFISKTHIIYRVSWNNIKSAKGKVEIQEKISKFIEFYNKL